MCATFLATDVMPRPSPAKRPRLLHSAIVPLRTWLTMQRSMKAQCSLSTPWFRCVPAATRTALFTFHLIVTLPIEPSMFVRSSAWDRSSLMCIISCNEILLYFNFKEVMASRAPLLSHNVCSCFVLQIFEKFQYGMERVLAVCMCSQCSCALNPRNCCAFEEELESLRCGICG